jgi:putative isomerase
VDNYKELKSNLARGWNTWNTRSVLSHVLLPSGLAINLGIKEYASGYHLHEALIGRLEPEAERIHPGVRAYDGSYTELKLGWKGIELVIQSAHEADDLVILVTPAASQIKPPLLVVQPGILWNRPGYVTRDGDTVVGILPNHQIAVYGSTRTVYEPNNIVAQGPYLAMPLQGPVWVSTGRPRTLDEVQTVMTGRRREQEHRIAAWGNLADVYSAIQTCMAWDTIYDPLNDRVISPVSRLWNCRWGGAVLFDWDTYFAAYMASLDNKELAYANAIEITREATERGFIPNFAAATGLKSRDRSQPPVGSFVVRELYRRFGERWLLEETFDCLLTWNRWWPQHREQQGLLCWGSDPYDLVTGNVWEHQGVNERFGAALESGLDNSPMYDDVPFDPNTHLLALADVGLNGMYIMDCEALADIATVLGRSVDAVELRGRAARYRGRMAELWSQERGIYLNRRTDTGAFSPRVSPTSFYPLLGGVPSQAQAKRMVQDHLYNPQEFWGEWIMPAIARDDPAYPDQNYWRGRIWAPMNLLVYLGLRHYDLPGARADLARKSSELLLKEWRARGHVHENYNANTGEGCDIESSDRFYHWGGLLGLIACIEAGRLPGPEEPLRQAGK